MRWQAAVEEEARLNDEFNAFEASPEVVVELRDERSLRWEKIAVRVYGDIKRVADVRRLYDQAKGPDASARSYTGRGRRYPDMSV